MPCSLSTIKTAACASGIAKEQGQIKLLQLIAQLTCEASQGTSSAVWGQITGTLANQADLQAQLTSIQASLDARNPLWVRTQNTEVILTGTTNETALFTASIPGGTLGANGWAQIYFVISCTNNANAKTIKFRLGGLGGTECASQMNAPSIGSAYSHRFFACRNSNSSKITTPATFSSPNPFAGGGLSVNAFSIDTSVSSDFVITGTLSNAADSISLQAAVISIFYRP